MADERAEFVGRLDRNRDTDRKCLVTSLSGSLNFLGRRIDVVNDPRQECSRYSRWRVARQATNFLHLSQLWRPAREADVAHRSHVTKEYQRLIKRVAGIVFFGT